MRDDLVPRLETERLILRAPVAEDFPAYAEFLRSDRSRYMGGPFDQTAAWGMFCSDLAMWSLFGHGALMIDRREDGRCVGQVGINQGPLFPEKELGWLLYAGFEERGYASEAAEAMLRWAFNERTLPTLVSYCDPANLRSQAVALRLGGVRDADAVRQDPEDVVFRYRSA